MSKVFEITKIREFIKNLKKLNFIEIETIKYKVKQGDKIEYIIKHRLYPTFIKRFTSRNWLFQLLFDELEKKYYLRFEPKFIGALKEFDELSDLMVLIKRYKGVAI